MKTKFVSSLEKLEKKETAINSLNQSKLDTDRTVRKGLDNFYLRQAKAAALKNGDSFYYNAHN